MISRKYDFTPSSYDEMHAKHFLPRTNENFKEDFAEAEELGVKHING